MNTTYKWRFRLILEKKDERVNLKKKITGIFKEINEYSKDVVEESYIFLISRFLEIFYFGMFKIDSIFSFTF